MTENATQPAAGAQNTAAENTESLLQIRFVPEFKAAAAARRLNARAPESHLATVRRAVLLESKDGQISQRDSAQSTLKALGSVELEYKAV